jgi:hypothetical protein
LFLSMSNGQVAVLVFLLKTSLKKVSKTVTRLLSDRRLSDRRLSDRHLSDLTFVRPWHLSTPTFVRPVHKMCLLSDLYIKCVICPTCHLSDLYIKCVICPTCHLYELYSELENRPWGDGSRGLGVKPPVGGWEPAC